MERALHIAISREDFHRIFNSFSPLLSATGDYELALANALSVKSEGQILKSYRNLIKSVYGGEILKFSSDVINKWVSKKTRRHIREIVNDAALANADLILLNAMSKLLARSQLRAGMSFPRTAKALVGSLTSRTLKATMLA